jgi:hypothetical protein
VSRHARFDCRGVDGRASITAFRVQQGSVVHILLLYALVLGVGVIGLPLGFIPHVFFPDYAAQSIGWPTGSPFQFEVGVHDGAWGVLGFL